MARCPDAVVAELLGGYAGASTCLLGRFASAVGLPGPLVLRIFPVSSEPGLVGFVFDTPAGAGRLGHPRLRGPVPDLAVVQGRLASGCRAVWKRKAHVRRFDERAARPRPHRRRRCANCMSAAERGSALRPGLGLIVRLLSGLSRFLDCPLFRIASFTSCTGESWIYWKLQAFLLRPVHWALCHPVRYGLGTLPRVRRSRLARQFVLAGEQRAGMKAVVSPLLLLCVLLVFVVDSEAQTPLGGLALGADTTGSVREWTTRARARWARLAVNGLAAQAQPGHVPETGRASSTAAEWGFSVDSSLPVHCDGFRNSCPHLGGHSGSPAIPRRWPLPSCGRRASRPAD